MLSVTRLSLAVITKNIYIEAYDAHYNIFDILFV